MRNSGALGRKKKPQGRWQAARLNSMPLVVRVGRGRGTSGGHTCPWSAVTITVESQKDTQPPAEVGSRPRRHGRNRKSPGHDGRPRGLCGTGGLGSGVSQVSARVRSMASPMRGHGQSQETCMETSGTRGCANSSARERTPKTMQDEERLAEKGARWWSQPTPGSETPVANEAMHQLDHRVSRPVLEALTPGASTGSTRVCRPQLMVPWAQLWRRAVLQ